jgi:hypothetical protein
MILSGFGNERIEMVLFFIPKGKGKFRQKVNPAVLPSLICCHATSEKFSLHDPRSFSPVILPGAQVL